MATFEPDADHELKQLEKIKVRPDSFARYSFIKYIFKDQFDILTEF